jgi:hypothetical protein
VAAGDYHRAAYVNDLLEVVRPGKPALSLRETAPAGVQAKADFFLQNGFVCVENTLTAAAIKRLQAAWEVAEGPSKAAWLEARQHGSGMARHSFKESAGGYPVVSRKWFGIDGLTYGRADEARV